MTILFTHELFLKHETGPYHPERPDRLRAVLGALGKPEFETLDWRKAPPATEKQVLRAHPKSHYDAIMATAPVTGIIRLDGDTVMSPDSADAAVHAAGAVVAAVDAVGGGEAKTAFCAVRPPGHHAEPTTAMGFCLFNNVAVGAYHARAQWGAHKVAVVDFDVHHGNGTQAMFADDRTMMYCSAHEHPLYPGTGLAHERGIDGNIVNVPLGAEAGSQGFRDAIEGAWLPALLAFQPDILFISAGFDAHELDPLANMTLTDDDYHWVTERLCDVAAQTCDGKVVSVLEGGYDLNGLAGGVSAHVRALMASN